jgi:hypothetical protein
MRKRGILSVNTNKRFLFATATLIVAALLSASVAASTFLKMSQAELLAVSSAVVEGKVLTVDAFWNDDRTLIYSEALIEVSDWIVGDAPGLVRVRTPGGSLGDYRIDAIGFPSFEPKDRLLLFLQPEGHDIMRVTGYRQGQYRIEVDAKGAEIAVPTLEADVLLIGQDGRRATPPDPMSLAALKDAIREMALDASTAAGGEER